LTSGDAVISAAVEGIVDRAVVERLSLELGLRVYSFHGLKGKPFLRKRIGAYNNAARFNPWLVLVDLDHCTCAAALRDAWLSAPSRLMRFRVAVHSVEVWLMADAETLANFLHVRRSLIPVVPDAQANPKELVVNLARRSSRAELRKDMVPRAQSGNSIGPAYSSRLIEYISDRNNGWRPRVAATRSESLRRCRDSLRTLTIR
jgi:hypothetical protein